MAKRQCLINFRFFPEIVTVAIVRFFERELKGGLTTQWGIVLGSGECLHWGVTVHVGDKIYRPNVCFEKQEEAEDYCQLIASFFSETCKVLLGSSTITFSSN